MPIRLVPLLFFATLCLACNDSDNKDKLLCEAEDRCDLACGTGCESVCNDFQESCKTS